MIQHLTFDELDRLITRIRSILWEEDGVMNADKLWDNDMLGQIADALRFTKLGPTYHIPHPVSDGVPPTPVTPLPVSEASVVDPMTYKVVAKRGRKPKPRNQLQTALETIIKSLPKRGLQHPTFDQVVLLDHSMLTCHAAATNVWSFEVGSGLDKPVVVFHKDLLDALKRAGPEPRLSLEPEYLVVAGDATTRVRINEVLVEDWPRHPALQRSIGCVKMTEPVIKTIVEVAEFSSTDRTRENISCVFINGSDVVGTDGHRLERRVLQDFPQLPTPVKINNLCTKALSTFTNAEFSYDDTFLQFSEGAVTLTIRALHTTFPDYRNVLPKSGEKFTRTVASFDRKQLHSFLSGCKNDIRNALLLELNSELEDDSWNHDGASLKEYIEGGSETHMTCYVRRPRLKDGESYKNLRVGFTPDYLTQALESSDLQFVHLHILDEFAPVIVSDKPDFDEALDGNINVLMPKRV